ncbi:unnamed protein product, partial [marine sediment metagenome]
MNVKIKSVEMREMKGLERVKVSKDINECSH